MSGRLGVWLQAARTMSPAQLLARGARRAGLDHRWLRRVDLLASAEAQRPLGSVDILSDALSRVGYGADVLQAALPGARVLEIGCGPHGGLGPACAAAGAVGYVGVDPGMDVGLLEDSRVRERWLVPALQAALTRFAPAGDAAAALARFDANCRYRASGLERCVDIRSAVDLFVSLSCLEHIDAFDAALAAMRAAAHEGARHLHLVNFSNHTSREDPFAGLYQMPLADYRKMWNGHVNGLRAPDMAAAFGRHGFDVDVVPIDVRANALPDDLHPWWTDRYRRADLAVRTALVVSRSLHPSPPASAVDA